MARILAYPQMEVGLAPRDLRFRFNWNAPIRVSRHDPKALYHCSQFVHRSTDEGQSWKTVSPDLSRNQKDKQDYAGSPITYENTGVEVNSNILSFEESLQTPGLFWAGSDDGLVHVSRDNGSTWQNVTPPGLPEWASIQSIEPSPHDPGRVFLAAHRYRLDDFRPWIYVTNDYGKTWRLLTDGKNGISAGTPSRVVREDPERRGLLYAGTERGLFVSFDDGARGRACSSISRRFRSPTFGSIGRISSFRRRGAVSGSWTTSRRFTRSRRGRPRRRTCSRRATPTAPRWP